MLKYFISPTGEKFPVKDCLEKGLLDAYYPRAYLAICAEERPWTGKPSTTQLINGTRYEYLRILTDYAIDPDSCAFRLIGTRAHKQLELKAHPDSFAELSIPDDEISGIMDCLEYQADGSAEILVTVDYKTWGSYKVKLALGMGTVKKTRPAVDAEGEPILYQRNGPGYKKGDQKTETYYEQAENDPEMIETELQVNRYRIIAEKYFDVHVDKMRVFAIVRDGGCVTATQRGITRNTYYIDVKRMDDDQVNEYFYKKRGLLIDAINEFEYKNHTVFTSKIDFNVLRFYCPPPCTSIESWGGRRCDRFCPVSDICDRIGG